MLEMKGRHFEIQSEGKSLGWDWETSERGVARTGWYWAIDRLRAMAAILATEHFALHADSRLLAAFLAHV